MRKTKKNDRRYTLRLPVDLDNGLKDYCSIHSRKAQDAVREAIKLFLTREKNPKSKI